MSIEIAIWRTEKPIGDIAAAKLYSRLIEGDLSKLQPHPSIEAFYRDLVARFPEIHDTPPEKIDDCPWSCKIDRSSVHLIVSTPFSIRQVLAEAVGNHIGELQMKHGLTAYVSAEEKEYFPNDD